MFYGVLSRSFHLTSSILAMPNFLADQGTPFKTILMQAMLANIKTSSGSPRIGMPVEYTLMQFIATVLNLLQFRMLRPAAYTRTHRFYQGEKDIGPVRAIIMPGVDTQPPALCNIFFPDQVSTFSYSRQMKNEITRVVSQGEWGFTGSDNMFQSLFPVYVVPAIPIIKENNKLFTGITTEESFRGIHPYYHLQSGPFAAAFKKEGAPQILDQLKTRTNNRADYEADVGGVFQQITAEQYLKRKYAGRSVTLECE